MQWVRGRAAAAADLWRADQPSSARICSSSSPPGATACTGVKQNPTSARPGIDEEEAAGPSSPKSPGAPFCRLLATCVLMQRTFNLLAWWLLLATSAPAPRPRGTCHWPACIAQSEPAPCQQMSGATNIGPPPDCSYLAPAPVTPSCGRGWQLQPGWQHRAHQQPASVQAGPGSSRRTPVLTAFSR